MKYFLLFFFVICISAGTATADTKRTLLISSYHPGFPTFFQQINGIKSSLKGSKIQLDVEFMDSKRFFDNQNIENFRKLLGYKLSKLPPYTAIITSDDNAFRFALKNRNELFPNTPIVFLGVNDISLAVQEAKKDHITGIVEATSFLTTLQIIESITHNINETVIISDSTPSGRADLNSIREIVKSHPSIKTKELLLSEISFKELYRRLSKLKSSQPVLLLSAYKDIDGNSLLFQESLDKIRQSSKTPVFHLWEHGIGSGSIGGHVVSHFKQGELAGERVRKIAEGFPIKKIPVIKSEQANIPLFDYLELKHFDLPIKQLPENSKILNLPPPSILVTHARLIISTLLIILILGIFLIISILNIKKRIAIETELLESKRELKAIIDNAMALIYVRDANGELLEANNEYHRLLDHTRNEDNKDSIESQHLKSDQSVFKTGQSMMFEEEVFFENNSHQYLTVKFPILDQYENIYAVGSISTEVTKIKAAELNIRKSEKKYRTLIETTGEAYVELDNAGVVQNVNQSTCTLLGYSQQELIGQSPSMFTLEEDIPLLRSQLAYIATKHQRQYSIRLLAKDQKVKHTQISATTMLDDKGKVIGSFALMRDLTDLYETKMQLEKGLARHQVLFDKANDAILMISEGKIIECNHRATILFKKEENELIGSAVEELSPVFQNKGQSSKMLANKYVELAMNREPQIFEWIFTQKNGNLFDAEVSMNRIDSDNEHILQAILHDLTERNKMQELIVQNEKMRSIGGLAAGIAHEINNPLSIILQSTQNIERRLNPNFQKNKEVAEKIGLDLEKVQLYLDERALHAMMKGIMEAVKRAAEIVKSMLNFSRGSESHRVEKNINEIIEQTLDLALNDYNIKTKYDLKKITITKEFGELSNTLCKETEISQVFLNLIKNSAQAMTEADPPTASPSILIRTYMEEDQNIIEIKDNGPGMDENTRKRIFEPFYTTRQVGEGSGLGLSISYFIIKNNHKGEISVNSEINKGTTFTIRLPQSLPQTNQD